MHKELEQEMGALLSRAVGQLPVAKDLPRLASRVTVHLPADHPRRLRSGSADNRVAELIQDLAALLGCKDSSADATAAGPTSSPSSSSTLTLNLTSSSSSDPAHAAAALLAAAPAPVAHAAKCLTQAFLAVGVAHLRAAIPDLELTRDLAQDPRGWTIDVAAVNHEGEWRQCAACGEWGGGDGRGGKNAPRLLLDFFFFFFFFFSRTRTNPEQFFVFRANMHFETLN
jgi:hypothetical protein